MKLSLLQIRSESTKPCDLQSKVESSYSSKITLDDRFLYNAQVKSLSELCELKKVNVVFVLYFIIYLLGLILSTH